MSQGYVHPSAKSLLNALSQLGGRKAVHSCGMTLGSGQGRHPKSIQRARFRDGERGRNRTYNLLIKSQLLCQLSYAPTMGKSMEGRTKIIAFVPLLGSRVRRKLSGYSAYDDVYLSGSGFSVLPADLEFARRRRRKRTPSHPSPTIIARLPRAKAINIRMEFIRTNLPSFV